MFDQWHNFTLEMFVTFPYIMVLLLSTLLNINITKYMWLRLNTSQYLCEHTDTKVYMQYHTWSIVSYTMVDKSYVGLQLMATLCQQLQQCIHFGGGGGSCSNCDSQNLILVCRATMHGQSPRHNIISDIPQATLNIEY